MVDRREKTAPSPTTALPDELLELVFLRLPSSLHLVRAACTCKRWRRIIADGGGFLRRFRTLHPRPVVAGHYRVDERQTGSCPPGRNPVFSLSPSADTAVHLRPRHFSLDFLPVCGGGSWELCDSRGGLLLLHQSTEEKFGPQLRHLVVCDPMARRCSRAIAPPAAFRDHQFLGAFLLDSHTEDAAGGHISLTNFRIIVALYDNAITRSCVFSSSIGNGNGNEGGWAMGTSKAVSFARPQMFIFFVGHVAESVYWMTMDDEVLLLDKDATELKLSSFSLPGDLRHEHVLHFMSRIVPCHDGAVRVALLQPGPAGGERLNLIVLIQPDGGDEWVYEKSIQLPRSVPEVNKIVSVAEGSVTLGTTGGVGIVSVDLAIATMGLNKLVTHNRSEYHGPAYMYHLPWPPRIQACLP